MSKDRNGLKLVAPKGPGFVDRAWVGFKNFHERLKDPRTLQSLVLNQIRFVGGLWLLQGAYTELVGLLLYYGLGWLFKEVLIWTLTEILFALYLIPRVL